MKDIEKRERHFAVRERAARDEEYDDAPVRRRSRIRDIDEEEDDRGRYRRTAEEEQPSRRRRKTEEEEEQPAPRRRRTLREREMEEEEEARNARRIRKGARRPKDEDDYDPDFDDEPSPKAPRIVRIFAWIALMLILFACGYLATNYFFSWSDKKGGERIGSVYGTGAEVKEAEKDAAAPVKETGTKFVLYIPKEQGFNSREVKLTAGNTREEDIKKLLTMYVDSLKETKSLAPATAINDIYQSGDWLYVDMTPSFQSSLKSLGRAGAERVLKGFTKTARENFEPIKKVKFYINSKEITDKNPVDLTQPWEKID
ncbi:MAG: GerMN domain-containing protein [Synergistes sp.]|nr:GerMN domain-containing protein [Synergistes sp.]